MMPNEDSVVILIKARVRQNARDEFVNWQTQLHTVVVHFPGFVSLEVCYFPDAFHNWVITQRFDTAQNASHWSQSKESQDLKKELRQILDLGKDALKEEMSQSSNLQGGVTEVFITQVSPGKEDNFRHWIAKIHQVEAKFPGFRGLYVQAPTESHSQNWISLLQFDTSENLDRWLSSPERQLILQESENLISSIESHRMISPYAGWFASVSKGGKAPAEWKQGMMVLLVLFPVVMLEMKYLNPLIINLNRSLGTFIGNMISVGLVTWPLMPIAIRMLRWWLSPPPSKEFAWGLQGFLLVLFLYALEVILLWNLL